MGRAQAKGPLSERELGSCTGSAVSIQMSTLAWQPRVTHLDVEHGYIAILGDARVDEGLGQVQTPKDPRSLVSQYALEDLVFDQRVGHGTASSSAQTNPAIAALPRASRRTACEARGDEGLGRADGEGRAGSVEAGDLRCFEQHVRADRVKVLVSCAVV